jgi:hypothetical protein
MPRCSETFAALAAALAKAQAELINPERPRPSGADDQERASAPSVMHRSQVASTSCARLWAFRRSAGMQPLPLPVRGGSIEALAPFLNLGSEVHMFVSRSRATDQKQLCRCGAGSLARSNVGSVGRARRSRNSKARPCYRDRFDRSRERRRPGAELSRR